MKRSKRRRDSIIPLSRQHHYALLLCLRIHRGLEKYKEDPNWLQKQVRKSIAFFESDLVPHFQAEENVLFPTMVGVPEASSLVDNLLAEHEEIRTRVDELRRIENHNENTTLVIALGSFADLLKAHIRKEERQFFPIYEEKVTIEVDNRIGQTILGLIGSAVRPNHPELLE